MRQRGTTYEIESNSYWQILQLMFGKYMW